MHNLSKGFIQVADIVYKKQFEIDQRLETEYDEYRKRRMYEDILHNLSFLEAAYQLDDDKLFSSYALWMYQLMVHLMPDIQPSRIKQQMITHYELLIDALQQTLDQKTFEIIKKQLFKAIEVTKDANKTENDSYIRQTKYQKECSQYLQFLLDGKANQAVQYIVDLSNSGMDIEEIYVDILQVVMTEIGNLWHQKIVSIEQEHYMTSITQTAISQFYSKIFKTKRKGLKILTCSVGGELHEMGARMISDLFENDGWDSIYLGAALPIHSVIKGIKEHQPDLIALSVTMPQHLSMCKELVESVKKAFPETKIAVGGRAFSMTDDIWKKWQVDISVNDARELISWANNHIGV